MKKLFERERDVAKRAREAVGALKPLRFNTTNLMSEIKAGGARAEDLVALILHVEDLTVSLTEVIGEVDAMIEASQKAQQAQKQVAPNGGRFA